MLQRKRPSSTHGQGPLHRGPRPPRSADVPNPLAAPSPSRLARHDAAVRRAGHSVGIACVSRKMMRFRAVAVRAEGGRLALRQASPFAAAGVPILRHSSVIPEANLNPCCCRPCGRHDPHNRQLTKLGVALGWWHWAGGTGLVRPSFRPFQPAAGRRPFTLGVCRAPTARKSAGPF